MTIISSLLYLDPTLGAAKAIPSGSIVDIAGTLGPTFTVGGKELLFADGTTTGDGSLFSVSLQDSYNYSGPGITDPAIVKMTTNKHLIFANAAGSVSYFVLNANTGELTINGNLTVNGTTTTVNSVVNDTDHYQITPGSATNIGLRINPDFGVTMSADLVNISAVHDAPGIFRITGSGSTIISALSVTNDLTVGGLINGVDVLALRNAFNAHTSVSSDKHQAKEINVLPGTFLHIPLPIGTTIHQVQTILEYLDVSINNVGTQVNDLSSDLDDLQDLVDDNYDDLQNQINDLATDQSTIPKGYTFTTNSPLIEWQIQHDKNSMNVVFNLFDLNGFQVYPESVQILDANAIRILFGEAQSGRANMVFYS